MSSTSTSPDDARERSSAPGMLRRGLAVIGVALRGAPGPFLVGGIASTVFAAATVASSLVLRWVTDEVVVPAYRAGEVETGLLGLALVLVVGVGTLKAFGVVGRRLGAYIAQFRLQATHRRAVTHRYLELPISWHRRHSTGQLLSNANADVESAFFIAAPLPMALGAVLMLIVTGALLLSTDPYLAAVGFSIGPLLGLANWYYQRRMRPAATVAQQARADVAEVAHESFDAALVVKTMGREAAEAERFRRVSDDLRDKMIEVGRLRAAFDPVIEGLPNIGILLVLLVGAGRVQEGILSAGDLILFAYLFRLVALPMRIFGFLLGEIPRAVVGWERITRVLQSTGDLPHGRRTPGGDHGAELGMDRVGFHHPATERTDLSVDAAPGRDVLAPPGADVEPAHTGRGLEGVDLDIPSGAVVALVGATGSGKSTIAALLVRLFDPDAGRVTFDGHDLRELSRDALAEQVAIVFQEAFLFDDTVRGNITLGADVSDVEVEAAARLARAHEFISRLPDGYDTEVGERGATLSGGQRQRIALARALVRRPRLLVLDDATSAVDPAVESEILHGLGEADLPSTVVVVAYRRSAIALADEVLFLEDGAITARGPHERLLEIEPAYAHLVTAYAEPGTHHLDLEADPGEGRDGRTS
jgi:ATP-binding cassette, subfamily B, bacterial